MEITTWNVNGIRALLRKDGWDWVKKQSPDVMCLQEIKAMPEQLTAAQSAEFEGYEQFWNPAEKKGYSGVATFIRDIEAETKAGMGKKKFDFEGRVLQTRFDDFILFNVYYPSGSRNYERVEYKLELYAAMLRKFNKLHKAGEKIVVCGDFNTAHEEIDLKNHKTNHKTSGFLPEERAWVTKYIDRGFVDPFRVLYPEKEQYTWWSLRSAARARNVGWRLDYFLVSEGLMPKVKDVVIHDQVLGSDHCPVSLIIK
ncbi:MAG: exodeoxyribonuclease III [Chloroflexi bacterium]|nr:MAG: exodeoxyribonuclease III [Chloroflexota bacterium]MBL1196075.1 exodeoxyribonuclease III [Chloroflexota bacterium]NOH13369.1 exodeoxyribonuclease III [Chloroflexota bacterium]